MTLYNEVLINLIDNILSALFQRIIYFNFSHHSGTSEVELLLDFIKHHRHTLGSKYFELKEVDEPFILTTLIFAHNRVNLDDKKIARICETVLTRLAEIFENIPGVFAKILDRWFLRSFKSPSYQPRKVCRINDAQLIEQTILGHYSSSVVLNILGYLATLPLDKEARGFLNSKVVKKTIGLALKIDPLAIVRTETTVSNFEPDTYGLSPLQIAAMHGNVSTIQNILENSKSSKLALAKYLTQDDEYYGISPLYLAISCSHEEACKTIMSFLKTTQASFDQSIEDLVASNDCFYNILSDAVGRVKENESIIRCFLNVVEATYSSAGMFKLVTHTHSRMHELEEDFTIFDLICMNEMYDVISRMIEISSKDRYFSDFLFMENGVAGLSLISRLALPLKLTSKKDGESQTTCFKNVLNTILLWKKEIEILDLFFGMNRSNDATIDLVVRIFCSPVVQDFAVQKLFGIAFSHFVQLLTTKRKYDPGFSSIWTEYCIQPNTSVPFIDKILNFISNGHEDKNVIEMIVHDDGKGKVIELAKQFGRDDVVHMMRDYLIKENYNALSELDDRLRNTVQENNDRHDWLSKW